MEIAALVRKEAKLNGYTDEDVSEMYRTINIERKHAKEIQTEVAAQKAQSNNEKAHGENHTRHSEGKEYNATKESSNHRTEPNRKTERAFNNDNTYSVRSPSGNRARKTESMILKLAERK